MCCELLQPNHAWRGEKDAGKYEDVAGFCKSVLVEEVEKHGFVLTPGRYVGAEELEDDDEGGLSIVITKFTTVDHCGILVGAAASS